MSLQADIWITHMGRLDWALVVAVVWVHVLPEGRVPEMKKAF
jgi:hypothetical protein